MVLEPRKSLTFLRVSPGGCSGVEKWIVGILFLAEDTPTFRTATIALRTTFIHRNYLRVIIAKSACSATCKHTHTDTEIHSKNAAARWGFKHKSMALQNWTRLLFYREHSLLSITQLLQFWSYSDFPSAHNSTFNRLVSESYAVNKKFCIKL